MTRITLVYVLELNREALNGRQCTITVTVRSSSATLHTWIICWVLLKFWCWFLVVYNHLAVLCSIHLLQSQWWRGSWIINTSVLSMARWLLTTYPSHATDATDPTHATCKELVSKASSSILILYGSTADASATQSCRSSRRPWRKSDCTSQLQVPRASGMITVTSDPGKGALQHSLNTQWLHKCMRYKVR